jgi:hypothetical protein
MTIDEKWHNVAIEKVFEKLSASENGSVLM